MVARAAKRPKRARRPEKGEYRSFFVAMVDDPDWLDLSSAATAVLWVLKAKLGRSQIDVLDVEILPKRAKTPIAQVEAGLAELERTNWIVRERNVIWIRNGLRHDPNETLSSPNGRKHVENHLLTLPRIPIVVRFADYYELDLPDQVRVQASPCEGATKGLGSPSPAPSVSGSEKEGASKGLRRVSAPRKTEDGRRNTDYNDEGSPSVAVVSESSSASESLADSIDEFCARTGATWKLKDRPTSMFAAALPAEFPALSDADLRREIGRAADWYVGEGRTVKAPHQALRNWLGKAKPAANGGAALDDEDAWIEKTRAELL